ncbi:MAG: acyl-CoA synthetase FdrA [Bacillota bacterium]|nr:acyl-CoA synthetase FdrA [Bacillota bacterium]
MRYFEIQKNVYYDSVTLMLLSSEINKLNGIAQAAVMMGTAHNIQLMTDAGLLTAQDGSNITPNDLIIGMIGQDEPVLDNAKQVLKEFFENKKSASENDEKIHVSSLDGAVTEMPDANIAVISVPGRYAAREAMKALKKNLHVLLFSDNVSLEEEISLKEYAAGHGLLMMGPDCGTAVINGIALGFANVVRRGSIGIAAASGTGLQELTCLIHRLGGGISQGLGTGGRDLKAAVGGRMMLLELQALAQDADTKVIGIISKPGDETVMRRIIEYCNQIAKPVAACFMGPKKDMDYGKILLTDTIEELGKALTALEKGMDERAATERMRQIRDTKTFSGEQAGHLKPEQKYIRALYSGGTLAYEALLLMEPKLKQVYSNISTHKEYLLENPEESKCHTILDMGEDYFTNGMPHPMIDMRLRSQRMRREAKDRNTGIFLLDCVLGFGCHEDPAAELVRMIDETRKENPDRHYIFIASVCGTDDDLQCRISQVRALKAAGVLVMDSNAEAVRLALEIAESMM